MTTPFRTRKKSRPPIALTGDLDELKLFLEEERDRLAMIERLLLEEPLSCDELLRRFHTFKADASFVQLRDLRQVGQECESLLTFLVSGELILNEKAVQLLVEATRLTRTLLKRVEHALTVDGLLHPVEGLEEFITSVRNVVATGLNKEKQAPKEEPIRTALPKSVRVEWEQLQRLAGLVERLKGITPVESPELVGLVHELQALALDLNRCSAEQLFGQVRRLVRDTSEAVGKEVDLELIGGGVLLPRYFASLLSEWLPHLIRNALDHGLEPPRERVVAGKEPVGSLTLAFTETESAWLIEVVDDGRGIAGGAEVIDQIFQAGYTTKEETDAISGRGVGLDVVAKGMCELGGLVEVATTPGEETTFTLSLPKEATL